jgi:aminomethyltransferase
MVEFAGFSMPVQYTSIREEHASVREAAGLFDVSHMGQLGLEGPGAIDGVDRLLCRRVTDLRAGRVRYGLLCNEQGGVVDDVTVYRLSKDRRWIAAHIPTNVRLRDTSAETGLLALQGPASAEALARVTTYDVAALRRFRFDRIEVAACEVLVSRTGYTGADGFEIYCGAGDLERIFEALLDEGSPVGLRPAGLGARDTLRLEAALPLYGHELDDETSPREAGLGRFVDLEGRDFIGAQAIRQRRDDGHERALVGFELVERGVARAGHPVTCEGRDVGRVTSGGPSPTLGKSIGLAYVPPRLVAPGSSFDVTVRSRAIPAQVVETPFVRGATAGRGKG